MFLGYIVNVNSVSFIISLTLNDNVPFIPCNPLSTLASNVEKIDS